MITKHLHYLLHASRKLGPVVALALLVVAMGGTWMTASSASAAPPPAAVPPATATTAPARGPDEPPAAKKSAHKDLAGKINLNTATEEQLMLLPTVGASKAERVVIWRKKNGGFKRTADLRHVKGFGYKTWKRLEPFLDIKGDTTLAAR